MARPVPHGDNANVAAHNVRSTPSSTVGHERAAGRRPLRRSRHLPTLGYRTLVLLGFAGAALLLLWMRWLAELPFIDVTVRLTADGQPVLLSTAEPELVLAHGRTLVALRAADGRMLPATALFPARSPRQVVADRERMQRQGMREALAEALQSGPVELEIEGGQRLRAVPHARGLSGLGTLCWLLSVLALALVLAALAVVIRRPAPAAMLYSLITLPMAVNLLLVASDYLPGLGAGHPLVAFDLPLRWLCEGVATAALVSTLTLYPARLPQAAWLQLGAWTVAAVAWLLLVGGKLHGAWWWSQAELALLWLLALGTVRLSILRSATPLKAMLQRFVLAGLGTLLLLLVAVAAVGHGAPTQHRVAAYSLTAWQVFCASLLLSAPFLSRSRQVVREFSVLAGIATVASALDLLFVAVLGLSQFSALVASLATSMVLYFSLRQWLLEHLADGSGLGAERMFESLYRAARTLEKAPEKAGDQLEALLREVFDPLELLRSSRQTQRVRVAADGSTLVVPEPRLIARDSPTRSIVLRFAHRGRHIFTPEDAQLAARIIDQLGRAVAYDRAVEQGRSEERARIAQDLHDDIGARLLTLMYKAPNPEIEEYIRHTLQDLKTLTRGLAASSHRLSHAAAEWKADLGQRLSAAGCDLQWSFTSDRDVVLTVVQWSGLTRVLRELVNNIIAHARATLVEVNLQVDRGRLLLTVSDDGIGRAPQNWSHGLGLGGVRKRVKLLGGQVVWQEREVGGIRCEVTATLGGEAPSRQLP